MNNLSLAASSPSLTTPIYSSMPAAAPTPGGGGGDGIFARSLDRVQPTPPAPPPASKVKIDSAGDQPPVDEAKPEDGVYARPSLDTLGAIQRTAAARQLALRSAAQAAEAAKRTGEDSGSAKWASTEPVVPETEIPGPGMHLPPDCEFLPDTGPTDSMPILVPPASLPAEAPPQRRLLVSSWPEGAAPDKPEPTEPGRLPPLLDNETLRPRRPGQDTMDPVKAATPSLSDYPISLPALQPAASARGGSDALSNTAASAEASARASAAALTALVPAADGTRVETTAQAELRGRPGSTEFAQQLGAQLAVWAKDGVQRASLQLNPLELGPVSVQIQLDGTGAQVTMAADLAATRLALEEALPSLAGSLREAGLTLTGGGVFDQARQQTGADGNGNGPRTGTRSSMPAFEGDDAARVTIATPRSRGVVDLMA